MKETLLQAGAHRPPGTDRPVSEKTSVAPLSMTREELQAIFLKHHDLVLRSAYRITGNAMDAEDVLQTLFLRLLRREYAPDFRGGARGFLHRAAVNIALDVVRRRARTVQLDGIDWRSLQDPHPGPDASRRASALAAWLRTALANLHPRAAEMFALRFLEGYSNPEIARMMGTSQATVAVILYRTRRRLRKELDSFL